MKLIYTPQLVNFMIAEKISYSIINESNVAYIYIDGELNNADCFALGVKYQEWSKNQVSEPIILDELQDPVLGDVVLTKERLVVGDYVYSSTYGTGKVIKDWGGDDNNLKWRPLVVQFITGDLHEYHRNGIWQRGPHQDVAADNCKRIAANDAQLAILDYMFKDMKKIFS